MDSPQPPRTRFGLKELASGKDPDVDIVAIHGINGDREDSWTADNGVLWLRDLLPAKVPNARILTYGYDGNTHGQEQLANDFMHEHALGFISKLSLYREITATTQRPIVFIAHGSGGLLLKSALIHGHLCHDDHLKHHLAIAQSTHGVTFFGTPHQGSAELARSILGSGSTLLQHLEQNSEALQQQLVHYSAISGRFETKFFYESYDTHVAGVSKKVVPKTSAIVPGAVNAEAIAIHKDHMHMVKFPSTDDEDFWTVSTILSLMSKAVCQKMAEKRNRYKSTIKETGLTPSLQSAFSGLLHVKAARFDASSNPRCLEGTREDLLKVIAEWTEQDISREGRRIFWLCGQAGTGKTTISLTVASSCKEKDQLGASFFFSRDHADRSDLRLVFPTIAHQLGIFHKPFKKSLAEVLEQDPDIVEMDPKSQFKKLIIEPIKSCSSFPASTIVLIDALDECKDESPISRILSIVSSHIYELPCLKFFITSRPEDHIRVGFNPLFPVTQTVILQNLEASVVDGDIEHYLRNGFSITAQLYPDLVKSNWPSDESIKSLVGKAGRLFIFAATAMNFILDRNYSDPPSQLAIVLGQSSAVDVSPSSPFSFLDQLYLQVLRQAFPLGTTPPLLNRLRNLLGAIVLSRDPLSPGALESLLNLVPGSARTTLRHLHSVIAIPATDERPIRLIHPSFFDFATSRCSDADFQIDFSECHEQLAIACFEQMKGLRRDICQIQDASKLNSEIDDLAERIERFIPPAMQYACHHWSFHFCIAGGDTLQGMLGDFCREQILYWIEALSFLGSLREGIRHLQDVSKFLNTSPVPSGNLVAALSDSAWFMTIHFELISCASLQLYRSALPLSTPSSFLHKTFNRELNRMRVLQGQFGRESSSVTILRGARGDVKSTNFSPDGALIVSASYGNEVRLWDHGTGTLLRKLNAEVEPKSAIIWARFFPDGTRVIVGTTTGTFSILNVATGACLQTTRLRGDSQKICYDISPDFAHIAGSSYKDIYIWHISNGDLLKILSGHSNHVNSVAFSPDHKLIASASADHTIRIWNAINYTWLSTLRGHSKSVMTIAFSPDSKCIISGSDANDIRLWDANTGVALKTLKGHTNRVCSVAFSPDGARVISGSFDSTLRVWDAIRGKLLKTIRCPGSVKNVGFSPAGTQYISSMAENIYIRDVDSAANLTELEEWNFKGVRFCDNGNRITSQVPSLLKIRCYVWDGLTGTLLVSPEHEYHTPPKLSPNSKYLVSFRGDLICLRDIASRTILWTFPSGPSITFSPDSTRLLLINRVPDVVIVAEGNTIAEVTILDVANGNNLFTHQYHGHYSYDPLAATFSDDGRQIILENKSYDIPPHARPLPVPSIEKPSEQLKYSIEGEWIFASNGTEKERCVWIPQDWRTREENYSSHHGRVAIGTRRGMVLLDLSGIRLSI